MIIAKIKSLLTNKPNKYLEQNIINLDLTVRTYNVLRRSGIATVGDLTEMSWNDLAGMRGVVRRTCVEVEDALRGLGLKLREGK